MPSLCIGVGNRIIRPRVVLNRVLNGVGGNPLWRRKGSTPHNDRAVPPRVIGKESVSLSELCKGERRP